MREGDKIGVALHRVRREVGEVNLVFRAVVLDHQVFAVEGGIDAKPEFAVVTGYRAVIRPASLVGRTRGVGDEVTAIGIAHVGGAEVKPLVKFGLVVGANCKQHICRVAAIDAVNIATVELAGNDHRFALIR